MDQPPPVIERQMVELFKHENPLVCALELSTLEYVESALFRIERGDSSLDRRERIKNKESAAIWREKNWTIYS